MHKFLNAIGFSSVLKREQLDELLNDVMNAPTDEAYIKKPNGDILVERSKEYGTFIGIAVRGTYDKEGKFQMEYYFPYFCGTKPTTEEKVEIERYGEKDAYAGICDDPRVGVPLIFYMQNPIEYYKHLYQKGGSSFFQSYLAALSIEGMILLPVEKETKSGKSRGGKPDRASLLSAAREGDEESIESLTLEELDIYSMISKRIQYEDVYTIVDTYFMPYGVETDNYSIMGTILDFHYIKNRVTNEECCILEVCCNDMIFEVCINTVNLMGEPAVGRRFKGTVWMQGVVVLK